MKKLISTLLTLIPLLSFGGGDPVEYKIPYQPTLSEVMLNYEIYDTSRDINLHLRSGLTNDGVGLIMMTGGAAFLIGGILTDPDKEWNGSTFEDQSFLKQGPRTYAILGGAGLFLGGVIYSLDI